MNNLLNYLHLIFSLSDVLVSVQQCFLLHFLQLFRLLRCFLLFLLFLHVEVVVLDELHLVVQISHHFLSFEISLHTPIQQLLLLGLQVLLDLADLFLLLHEAFLSDKPQVLLDRIVFFYFFPF